MLLVETTLCQNRGEKLTGAPYLRKQNKKINLLFLTALPSTVKGNHRELKERTRKTAFLRCPNIAQVLSGISFLPRKSAWYWVCEAGEAR
jgi:hypothetical protein